MGLPVPAAAAVDGSIRSGRTPGVLRRPALPRICRAVKKVTGCAAYNVLQNNESQAHQAVFHVHFHIIPKPDERHGVGIRWPTGSLDPDAAELAQALAAEIGRAA